VTKSLFYEVKFVTLHQKAPGSLTLHLKVRGVETSTTKYGLEAGFGDPGEDPRFDNFDYAEFSIVGATFDRPADFGARDHYTAEGGQRSHARWGVVSVPDDFAIPPELWRADSGWSTAGSVDGRTAWSPFATRSGRRAPWSAAVLPIAPRTGGRS
jgi:hypothetical protein